MKKEEKKEEVKKEEKKEEVKKEEKKEEVKKEQKKEEVKKEQKKEESSSSEESSSEESSSSDESPVKEVKKEVKKEEKEEKKEEKEEKKKVESSESSSSEDSSSEESSSESEKEKKKPAAKEEPKKSTAKVTVFSVHRHSKPSFIHPYSVYVTAMTIGELLSLFVPEGNAFRAHIIILRCKRKKYVNLGGGVIILNIPRHLGLPDVANEVLRVEGQIPSVLSLYYWSDYNTLDLYYLLSNTIYKCVLIY